MSGGRLTGQEPDVDFLIQTGFSSIEIARISAIKSRPARQHQTSISVVPCLFSEYNGMHKACYAEVFGDEAAKLIFGDGPWLKSWQREKRRMKKQYEKAS